MLISIRPLTNACAQADEPYPNENVIPPPDQESDVESRINSDNDDRDSNRDDREQDSDDDGEDLMDNFEGYEFDPELASSRIS